MRVLTISNLHPRPDRPQLGMFNAQLFEQFARTVEVVNICLVPEWRVWRWPRIRRARLPTPSSYPTYFLPVPYVPVFSRNRGPRVYALTMRSLTDRVAATDVVYASWLFPDGVAATHLAARCRRPSWTMVLGSDTFHLQQPARRRQIVAASGHAAGLVCVCRLLADRLVRAGVPSSKTHVVPNGVDPSVFRYRSRVEGMAGLVACRGDFDSPSWLARPGGPVVLFVGNLVHVKGPDILSRAFDSFRRLRGAIAPVRLVVIGEGPMRAELERWALSPGLAGSVFFAGCRPHHEVAMWMNVADCLCLPSRSEGMPNVVLEAAASGLPVVAADVGACREMVGGDPLARVVDPGDASGMAEAMALLSSASDETRQALAQRHGRRTWGDQARAILDLVGNQHRR